MSIALVQGVIKGSNAGVYTLTLNVTGVTAGNLLCFVVNFNQASTPSSVVDSNGTVQAAVAYQTYSGGVNGSGLYYVQNCNSGTHGLTVTYPTTPTGHIEIAAVEFSGIATVSALDVAATNNQGSSLSATTNAATPSQSGNLAVAVISTTATSLTFSSWLNSYTAPATQGNADGFGYLITGSGSTSSGATLSSSSAYQAALAIFKSAASTPTVTSGSAIRMSGTAVRIGMAPLMMMPLGWIIERRRRLARKPGAEFVRDEKTGLMLPRDLK